MSLRPILPTIALVATLLSQTATAGGLLLPVRGVRTVARAGAFVAGADDADALWQNPAGLAHGTGEHKRSLLFDAAFVYQTVEYARIDSEGTAHPAIANQQPGQPIVSLASSLGLGDRLVIAGGLSSPYSAPHRYAVDGPQRYASIGTGSTSTVVVAVGVAYAVSKRFRIGATLEDVVSRVSSQVALSACLDLTTCSAEDPAFDSIATIDQTDYVSPSGSIGLQYDVLWRHDHPEPRVLTAGLAVHAPARVSSTGTLDAKLPTSSAFMGATVAGDGVRVSYVLPPRLRAGVEYRPSTMLRIEAALDVELWSLHDDVAIEPDVRFENVPGRGTVTLAAMTIARDYVTSISPSLGVEWRLPKLMLAAGYAYETAAAPASTVSVAAVDAAKHLIGLGGGYEADGWQIGAAIGWVSLATVDVGAAEARVLQLAPVRAAPSVAVNAGAYRSRYLLAGLRFARRW